MRLGMFMMPVHPPGRSLSDTLAEDTTKSILADKLGYDELWMGEHFSATTEPFPSPLMFLAGLVPQTKNLTFGTAVINLPNHHPAIVAAEAAQFDHMSGGRFMFGVGSGGLASDFELFTVGDPPTRQRKYELVEPGVTPAPIHYESHRLDVAATTALVAKVRASVARSSSAALDQIASAISEPIVSISLRAWPPDFPDDIAVQRRASYEARADAVMYRQVLSELAHDREWEVHLYDAKAVETQAVSLLAVRADEVLHGPRATLGPPWAKDHRIALAATILACG